MICLEVYRNGEKIRTIGEEEASYIRINSVCFPDRAYANMQVFVERESFYKFMRRTPHFGINVELGDEITVKFVEASAADPVDPHPAMGSRRRDDAHELLCSLCGKSSRKAKRMVGTAVGFICAGCIEVAYETIQMPPATPEA